MKVIVSLLTIAFFTISLGHAGPVVTKDIPYYDGPALEKADEYRKSQCKLDIRGPEGASGLPVLVWYHGGGLTGGKREIPALADPGVVLVGVSYRFAPPGDFPCFLEDAAASTAWVVKHIAEYGGDPRKVFVGGHSAGGYLALMIGQDPKWLAPHGISNLSLAGLIPVSAQVTTHFHVKKLRGDTGPQLRPVIDEFAPLYHASKDLPPICLVTGDRAIEYKSRVEENVLFAITLKNLGHPDFEFHELPGLDHGTVNKGSMPLVAAFIKRLSAPK